MYPTKENAVNLNLGRRESDKWLSALLSNVLVNVAKRADNSAPKAFKPLIASKNIRRPRRTRIQLRKALKMALEAVKAEFTTWPSRRQLTRAKALVRSYKY